MSGKVEFTFFPIYLENLNHKLAYEKEITCNKINNSDLQKCDDVSIYDFFDKEYDSKLFLKIESKNKKIIEIKEKGKKYYASIDESYFTNNRWPDGSRWKVIDGESAKSRYNKLLRNNIKLREFLSMLESCANRNDFECFDKISILPGMVLKSTKQRMVADNPKLCKEFLSSESMDGIVNKVSTSPQNILLKKLKTVLDDNNKNRNIVIRSYIFNENNSYELGISKIKLECFNLTDIKISFSKKPNKGWLITEFSMFDFNNGENDSS